RFILRGAGQPDKKIQITLELGIQHQVAVLVDPYLAINIDVFNGVAHGEFGEIGLQSAGRYGVSSTGGFACCVRERLRPWGGTLHPSAQAPIFWRDRKSTRLNSIT